MKNIKIAAGSGFWGDWQDAPVNQLRLGQVDYLVLDYLAELTMSVLAKQREKSPEHGYARDFADLISEVVPDLLKSKTRIIANAGGVNPQACAGAIRAVLNATPGAQNIKVACVFGDDITNNIEQLLLNGEQLLNLDSNQAITTLKHKIVSANAYLGAKPIVEALATGAQIIVTGRVSDAALALAPMIHEFAWSDSDYDQLALGTIAGHIIECGAQASGGNCSLDWQNISGLEQIGYPIIEIGDAGCFITKHPHTGGRVSVETVKEQLIYEIGDPKQYITPDVIADFTSITLREIEADRVEISGAKGRPATNSYKVSISYENGFKAENSLIYSWPEAREKAAAAEKIFRSRIQNLVLSEILIEHIGLNALHGNTITESEQEPAEVMLRVAARSDNRSVLQKFSKQLVPLVLSGPPSVSGYTSGGKISEIYSYWPALVSKTAVDPQIKVELF